MIPIMVAKKRKRTSYAKVEGQRYINVPVSEEVYQAVRAAAAAAVEGGMLMRFWVERALKIQAGRESKKAGR